MMLSSVILNQLGWFCPLVIWIMLVNFFCAICLGIQAGIVQLRRLHQIPCSNCTFYTGETCLKCTIHPYQAFTEDAINCQDWESKWTMDNKRLSAARKIN